MRRILSLLLLLLILPASLLSCGGKVTEEEIFPEAEALIRASLVLNRIYLGEGIPTGEVAFENYSYADEAFCEANGFLSVSELKKKTEEVYTVAVAEILYRKSFTTEADPLGALGEYRDIPGGGIYVLTEREMWYTDETEYEYLFDTMTLDSAAKNGATVSLTVRITRDGKTQERLLSIPFVREEDGWRCDKLTYIAYDPALD